MYWLLEFWTMCESGVSKWSRGRKRPAHLSSCILWQRGQKIEALIWGERWRWSMHLSNSGLGRNLWMNRMPWREETGVRFCKSDSWAPPVSLLRAASREQTANQRPDKLSLPFVWSLPLVPGLAIGWSTLFVFRLSSLALIRLVSTHILSCLITHKSLFQ